MINVQDDSKMGRIEPAIDKKSNKFDKVFRFIKSRNFLIPLALVVVGSATYFAFAATPAPPLGPQDLINAITTPGVKPAGTTDNNVINPRYSENSAGPMQWRLAPGKVEISNGDGKYAKGFGPWIELSSLSRTNPGNANVAIVDAHLYSLSKSTGQWTDRVQWGGPLGWAGQLWLWDGGKSDTTGTISGPNSSDARGWSTSMGGYRFGQPLKDSQVNGEDGFLRIHGWPNSWTGKNGFFWTSVNPNIETSAPDINKLNDLDGMVMTVQYAVVGDASAVANSKFAATVGVDTYWEGLNTTGLVPGDRTGSGSGFRALNPNGGLIVFSTLSRAQVAAHPLTAYPGWTDSGSTSNQNPITNPAVTLAVTSSSTKVPATVTVQATSSLASTINIKQGSLTLKTCTSATSCDYSSSFSTASTYEFTAQASTLAGGTGSASKSITLQSGSSGGTTGTSGGSGTTVTNGIYNDTDSLVTYSGGWQAGSTSSAYKQDEHYSNTPGSTATVKFTGEQLQLISHGNTDMGQATVTVDGVLQPNSGEWYSPSPGVGTLNNWTSQTKFDKTKQHTAVVKISSSRNGASNGNYVSIDKIVVSDSTQPPTSLSSGLQATYYKSKNLSGGIVNRVDSKIDFQWKDAAPLKGFGADNFSTRWTGKIKVPNNGNYTFHTSSDDGVRVWINNKLVIDNWTDHAWTDNSVTVNNLIAGVQYDIKVEYYENGGWAIMRLLWSGPGVTDQVIPSSAFLH